ncbi:YbbR family protein [Candidatus Sulfopaludibacter sp. SbA6]|nr:YbbR family protein [Candidatus Sulfopaludibacter sp. SbA6]
MNRVLKWTRAMLWENFGWKMLSLGMAVLIWALVATEPELGTRAAVRLEYKNLPEDLEFSSEPAGPITLELRGPSGQLSGLNPSVILDMANVQPGVRTFKIGEENVKLPHGVRLVSANPSVVRFEFDRRLVRSVPVRARFLGEGQNGYVVVSYSVEPPELRIEGPAKKVSRIAAVSTDPVDVSSVVGSSEFRVNAFVDDPYVRFETSPQVRVTVSMKKK